MDSHGFGRWSFVFHKYLTSLTRGGITSNEVANDDGTTRIVTEPNEVLNLILKGNHAHFSQATGTLFMIPPISTWLGKCGETEIWQDILLNARDKSDLDYVCPFTETQIILDALQPFDPAAKPVPITGTKADYRKFFRKWTGSTSTLASGKHLGHYKALEAPSNRPWWYCHNRTPHHWLLSRLPTHQDRMVTTSTRASWMHIKRGTTTQRIPILRQVNQINTCFRQSCLQQSRLL